MKSMKRELPPRIMAVIRLAAIENDVTPDRLFEEGKLGGRAMLARRVAVCRLRAMGFSLAEIGRFMGLHHTSVLHHLKVRRRQLGIGRTSKRDDDPVIPDLSGEWAI